MVRHPCLAFFLLALLSGMPSVAPGQNRREPEREGVQIAGTVKDFQGSVLQVTANDGETWLVKLNTNRNAPQDAMTYTAKATFDWLRAGMFVRFRANVNQRLLVDGPVNELTVFTPSPENPLGIVPEANLGQGIFADTAPEKKPDKDRSVLCNVAGRLVGSKKGKLLIAAGVGSLSIEVPDDVKIHVEIADLSFMQPGDKVEIAGWKYQMVPGRAVADRIAVSAEKPLTGPVPKSSRDATSKTKDKEREKGKPPDASKS